MRKDLFNERRKKDCASKLKNYFCRRKIQIAGSIHDYREWNFFIKQIDRLNYDDFVIEDIATKCKFFRRVDEV